MSKERFKVKFAVYFIARRGNEVLLSQRMNTGYMDGMFSLVAGHVDGGEAAEAALVREIREEAGIKVDADDLELVFTTHRLGDAPDDEYVDLFFEGRKWQGELTNCEPEKCGGLEWYDVDELPSNTLQHVRDVLTSYEVGKRYLSRQGVEL
jgi:8-oxo-dGTP pyrophosphatase MutT (NUDIX family)